MFTVDAASGTPPYEQVRRQIVDQITDGTLLPGTRMPTVRQLAAQLGLAANTVARSYRELEASGHLVTRGRLGTSVADTVPQQPGVDAEVALRQAARRYVAAAAALHVDDEAELLEAVRAASRDAAPPHRRSHA